jgi:hypothetical protein
VPQEQVDVTLGDAECLLDGLHDVPHGGRLRTVTVVVVDKTAEPVNCDTNARLLRSIRHGADEWGRGAERHSVSDLGGPEHILSQRIMSNSSSN